VRLHPDPVAEIAALDCLRSFFNAVDRARDRVDQHRREQRRHHVDEEQHHREARDDVEQDPHVLIRSGAEVELKQRRDRIDDQREQLMFFVAAAGVPVIE
jgi:hypothetical protein